MSDKNMDEYDISIYFSLSRTKWAEKILQDAGELVGNPQEPRKTRPQTSNCSFKSDSSLAESLLYSDWI